MKKIFLLSMLAVLFLTSCSEDKGDLTLNFQLIYDDEPMVMLQPYDYPTGGKFFLSRVSFYISDVKLGAESILPVEYIDLSNSHATFESAKNGLDYTITDLPADNYTSLSFALGISASDNAKKPGDYTSSSPLSRSGEYWNAWESYVFYKIEGMLDTDNDGTMDQGVALHMGGDEVYKLLSFEKGYVVDSDKTNKAIIKIDLAKVFGKGGKVYDLFANPNLHSKTKHGDKMKILMDNTSKAITLE